MGGLKIDNNREGKSGGDCTLMLTELTELADRVKTEDRFGLNARMGAEARVCRWLWDVTRK
jgi:hypothetical protein